MATKKTAKNTLDAVLLGVPVREMLRQAARDAEKPGSYVEDEDDADESLADWWDALVESWSGEEGDRLSGALDQLVKAGAGRARVLEELREIHYAVRSPHGHRKFLQSHLKDVRDCLESLHRVVWTFMVHRTVEEDRRLLLAWGVLDREEEEVAKRVKSADRDPHAEQNRLICDFLMTVGRVKVPQRTVMVLLNGIGVPFTHAALRTRISRCATQRGKPKRKGPARPKLRKKPGRPTKTLTAGFHGTSKRRPPDGWQW